MSICYDCVNKKEKCSEDYITKCSGFKEKGGIDMLREDTKQKLFEFLQDCENKKLSFIETITLLRYSGALSLTEVLEYLAEYERYKNNGN